MREWVWLGHMIDRVAIIKACASTGRDHICIFKVSIILYFAIAKHYYNYHTYSENQAINRKNDEVTSTIRCSHSSCFSIRAPSPIRLLEAGARQALREFGH